MLYIELLGMPRAGKSTIRQLIVDWFESDCIKVDQIIDREIVKKINIKENTDPINISLMMIAEVTSRCLNTKSSVVVLDRGFHDIPIWLLAHNASTEMVHLPFALKQMICDKSIYLTIKFDLDVEEAMKRHKNCEEKDPIDDGVMNNYYLLSRLQDKYKTRSNADITVSGYLSTDQQWEIIRSKLQDLLLKSIEEYIEEYENIPMLKNRSVSCQYIKEVVVAKNRYYLTEYISDKEIDAALIYCKYYQI